MESRNEIPSSPEAPHPDQVYLGHVTALGETREVLAREDIVSEQGARLVRQGTRLGAQLYEQLAGQRLRKPIDLSILIEDGVTVTALVREARRLIEAEPQLEAMIAYLRDYHGPLEALGRIPLNPALTVKLTVAHERTPRMFAHCVRVALGSVILGASLRLTNDELGCLAAAGIFHDLGELHVDPALLDRSRSLSEDERRRLYAHPVIAYRMLQPFPEYHPRISRPVLEHHERVDGSGYPNGLPGAAISRLGRVLALGELAAGVCERNSCAQLETLLKFQAEKYGPDLVSHLASALRAARTARRAAPGIDRAQLGERLNVLNDALTAWLELTARLKPETDFSNDPGDPAGLLAARFRGLEHAFARTGLAFTDIRKAVETFDGDSAALGELENLTHEALFQLEELTHELRRRWPALDSASDPASVATVEWIKRAEGPIVRALRAGRDSASTAAPPQPAGRTVH